jgi:predicted chitinase
MFEAVHIVTLMPTTVDGKASVYLPYLRDAMYYCEINTSRRQAAFLAQVARDSDELHLRPKNAATTKYGARGWFPIEGRENYWRFKVWSGYDFLTKPQHVEKAEWNPYLAAYQFRRLGCNQMADSWAVSQIIQTMKGKLDADEIGVRLAYFSKAARILGAELPVPHI